MNFFNILWWFCLKYVYIREQNCMISNKEKNPNINTKDKLIFNIIVKIINFLKNMNCNETLLNYTTQ